MSGSVAWLRIESTAVLVGHVDKQINQQNSPPYNAYREEAACIFVERGPTDFAFVGIMFFFLTCRLFKYLRIFPVLLVPFKALVNSVYEIFAFFITLGLIMFAFSLTFSSMYGGDIDKFSGILTSLSTLFNAALDGFDDDVTDRLAEMGGVQETVGNILVYVFTALVTLSFMNMLITITMAWYEEERGKAESQKFLADGLKEKLDGFTDDVDRLGKMLVASMRSKAHISEASGEEVKEADPDPDQEPQPSESEDDAPRWVRELRDEIQARDERLLSESRMRDERILSEVRRMLLTISPGMSGGAGGGPSSSPPQQPKPQQQKRSRSQPPAQARRRRAEASPSRRISDRETAWKLERLQAS